MGKSGADRAASWQLSAREEQVLKLIAAGLSNDEIARDLYLSQNSVKSYIRTCYKKIGVSGRVPAVLFAIRHGFFDPYANP